MAFGSVVDADDDDNGKKNTVFFFAFAEEKSHTSYFNIRPLSGVFGRDAFWLRIQTRASANDCRI